MRDQPMGVLEALAWIEAWGATALTTEEVSWAEAAAERRGCRLRTNYLSDADRLRVMALGQRCRAAKDQKRS